MDNVLIYGFCVYVRDFLKSSCWTRSQFLRSHQGQADIRFYDVERG